MATIVVQEATVQGLDSVTFSAADVAGDDSAAGLGRALIIRNNDTVTHNITVDTPITVRGLVVANPQVDVPAGEIGMVPLIAAVFGKFPTWTYDSVTSLEVAVVELAR